MPTYSTGLTLFYLDYFRLFYLDNNFLIIWWITDIWCAALAIRTVYFVKRLYHVFYFSEGIVSSQPTTREERSGCHRDVLRNSDKVSNVEDNDIFLKSAEYDKRLMKI